MSQSPVLVSLSEINCGDVSYRVSRPPLNEQLLVSIKKHGVLEPVCLYGALPYIPLSGHNRLLSAVSLGLTHINAYIHTDSPADFLYRHVILKNYKGEVGPIGKLNAMMMLRQYACAGIDMKNLAAELSVPYYFDDETIIRRVISFDQTFLEYLDVKDANFKLIKTMLSFPPDALEYVVTQTVCAQFRINIFKQMIESVADILRRDDSIGAIQDIRYDANSDKRIAEEKYVAALKSVLYPGYSAASKRAAAISEKYHGQGIEFSLPAFFEGSEIDMHIKLNRRKSFEEIQKRINAIPPSDIDGLLKLL